MKCMFIVLIIETISIQWCLGSDMSTISTTILSLKRDSSGNCTILNKESNYLKLIWLKNKKVWIGETEITLSQISLWNPKVVSTRYFKTWPGYSPQWPAMNISASQAEAYCKWLSQNLPPDSKDLYRFRLPSTDEWMEVASCGDNRLYAWGNSWPPAKMTDGNFPNLSGEDAARLGLNKIPNAFPNIMEGNYIPGYYDGWPIVCPVQNSGRNEYGIMGIGGNIQEWCYDNKLKQYVLKDADAATHLEDGAKISREEVLPSRRWPFFPLLEDKRSNWGTGFRIVLASYK